MAVVLLRAPLSQRTAGSGRHDLPGDSVGEVLRELERLYPPVTGWILDERGHIRAHVNVFVNGERTTEDAAVGATDELHVLPSISGGSTS
jgi:molybdopterin synthase sulfur carrier subunit